MTERALGRRHEHWVLLPVQPPAGCVAACTPPSLTWQGISSSALLFCELMCPFQDPTLPVLTLPPPQCDPGSPRSPAAFCAVVCTLLLNLLIASPFPSFIVQLKSTSPQTSFDRLLGWFKLVLFLDSKWVSWHSPPTFSPSLLAKAE